MSFCEAGIIFRKIIATKCVTICQKLIKIRICFIFDVNIKVTHDNNTFIFAKVFVNLSKKKKNIYVRIAWGYHYTENCPLNVFNHYFRSHNVAIENRCTFQ